MTSALRKKVNYYVCAFLGFALGVFAAPLLITPELPFAGRPPDQKTQLEHMVKHFSRQLDLNSKQEEQVTGIFLASHEELMAIHKEIQPRLIVMRDSVHSEIRSVLSAEQLQTLEEIESRAQEERKHRGITDEIPPPPPPPVF